MIYRKGQLRFVNPEWQAPVPMFSWCGLLSPVFLSVLLTSMSISLFVSDEVAQSHPAAIAFSKTVRQALLSVSSSADINAHAMNTSFPHTALLSHAFMWASMTFLLAFNTVTSLIKWHHHMEWLHLVRPTLIKREIQPSQLMGVFLFTFGGAAVFSMMPGSNSFIRHADLSSKVFFSLLTGIFIFQTQILSGWLPLSFYFFTRFFRR